VIDRPPFHGELALKVDQQGPADDRFLSPQLNPEVWGPGGQAVGSHPVVMPEPVIAHMPETIDLTRALKEKLVHVIIQNRVVDLEDLVPVRVPLREQGGLEGVERIVKVEHLAADNAPGRFPDLRWPG
jgi:hypothetical protein